MKKILCLLLAITCVFAICSCGGGVSVQDIVEKSQATETKTRVTYILGSDKLVGNYSTKTDGTKAAFTFEYQDYAKISEMQEGRIKTVSGTVNYVDGKVYSESGEELAASEMTAIVNFKLELDESRFKSYEYFDNGNSVTAVVAAEDAERVIGVALSAEGDVTITVKTNGTYLYGVNIAYTAKSGASVLVETSYTYDPVVLDFEGAIVE